MPAPLSDNNRDQEAQKLYNELIKEWNRKEKLHDVAKLEYTINELKVLLSDALLGPFSLVQRSKAQHLMLRDTLEIAAQLNLNKNDIKGFQRHYEQLKLYYFDQPREDIEESPSMRQLSGLYLLSLLAENRIGAFHCEIELLAPELLENDIYIAHPVKLERNLTEGSYEKIFAASHNVPAEQYKVLMRAVMETVRKEIASCICRSCKVISLKEVSQWLFLEKPDEAMEFIQRLGWKLGADKNIDFSDISTEPNGVAQQGGQLKFEEVRDTVLDYAKRIEQIV